MPLIPRSHAITLVLHCTVSRNQPFSFTILCGYSTFKWKMSLLLVTYTGVWLPHWVSIDNPVILLFAWWKAPHRPFPLRQFVWEVVQLEIALKFYLRNGNIQFRGNTFLFMRRCGRQTADLFVMGLIPILNDVYQLECGNAPLTQLYLTHHM